MANDHITLFFQQLLPQHIGFLEIAIFKEITKCPAIETIHIFSETPAILETLAVNSKQFCASTAKVTLLPNAKYLFTLHGTECNTICKALALTFNYQQIRQDLISHHAILWYDNALHHDYVAINLTTVQAPETPLRQSVTLYKKPVTLEQFTTAYYKDYYSQGFFARNPFSDMGMLLKKPDLKIQDIIQYKTMHPQSRTAKVYDECEKVNLIRG